MKKRDPNFRIHPDDPNSQTKLFPGNSGHSDEFGNWDRP